MAYEHIIVEREGRVGRIRLNRPQRMNALSVALMDEVGEALAELARDDGIGAVILTGDARAFAAGADIGDMSELDYAEVLKRDFPFNASGWQALIDFRKPVIAAVAGVCLGGGCELAMACDLIIAADSAKFGQPEVRLGIMPGAGGTQRLVRAIGKAKAMELCLTGRTMDAHEAERAGLVARVVPADELDARALETAATIGGHSLPSTLLIKESINQAFETPLRSGLATERRLFQSTFATADQAEGMAAFLAKRAPEFRHE